MHLVSIRDSHHKVGYMSLSAYWTIGLGGLFRRQPPLGASVKNTGIRSLESDQTKSASTVFPRQGH